MQIEPVQRMDGVEILPPEQTDKEREQIRHRALADSARGLSVDERYVLRRMASIVADSPSAGVSFAGVSVVLPVAEFAASAGITFKVARRRLDHAVQALFSRTVSVQYSDRWEGFRWTDARSEYADAFEMNFSGPFLRHLRAIAIAGGSSQTLQPFADAVNAPAVTARGFKVPGDLSVVLVSRLQARQKRPTGMTKAQLKQRLRKRLKRVLDRDGIQDAEDALSAKGPLRSGHKYTKYSHRDLDLLYNWVMKNKDKPDYLEL